MCTRLIPLSGKATAVLDAAITPAAKRKAVLWYLNKLPFPHMAGDFLPERKMLLKKPTLSDGEERLLEIAYRRSS